MSEQHVTRTVNLRDPLGDRWSWECSCGAYGKTEYHLIEDAVSDAGAHRNESEDEPGGVAV